MPLRISYPQFDKSFGRSYVPLTYQEFDNDNIPPTENDTSFLDNNEDFEKDIIKAITNTNKRAYLGHHPILKDDKIQQHKYIIQFLHTFIQKYNHEHALGNFGTDESMMHRMKNRVRTMTHNIKHTMKRMLGMPTSDGGKKRRGKYNNRYTFKR